jgi:hypothetical protein
MGKYGIDSDDCNRAIARWMYRLKQEIIKGAEFLITKQSDYFISMYCCSDIRPFWNTHGQQSFHEPAGNEGHELSCVSCTILENNRYMVKECDEVQIRCEFIIILPSVCCYLSLVVVVIVVVILNVDFSRRIYQADF